MTVFQGIVILGAICALASAPWFWRRAQQADAREQELTGRQAAARHMFGERYQWDPVFMDLYDTRAWIRGIWEARVDDRLRA